MRLGELVADIAPGDGPAPGTSADVEIAGLAYDSRKVGPGTLFFCVPGEKAASSKPGTEVVDLSETAPPIRAPYPTRIVRPSITVPAFYKYILVHGYVSQTGRVERLHIVRPVTPAIDQAILASLAGWEFRSATRDGVQIAVEFLLSIPISGL